MAFVSPWRTKVGILKGLRGGDVVALAIMFCAFGLFVPRSHAQVGTNITSSGLGTAVNGSTTLPCLGGTCTITGGDRRGQNLFHSFGLFNIGTGNTANFSNDSALATSNILARVNGGQTSNIFGTIQTTNFGAANLFLMNPAGWIFGPTARLNVAGSFHATTADYIKLGNDGIFHADPARPTMLSVAPPSAFGFLTNNPAAIDVNSRTPLTAATGRTLSFVAGPVNVGAANGSAPGFVLVPGPTAGRVNLVSVASPGEATFDGTGFNIDGFAQQGNISIRGASIVDGREVFIRGGRLEIRDGLVFPGGFSTLAGGPPPPNGGEVNVKVTNDVVIAGAGRVPVIGDFPGIQTLSGSPRAVLSGNFDVADIRVQANAVSMSGQAVIKGTRLGPGAPPDLIINANSVKLDNGAVIGIDNRFAGPGGSITLNAHEVALSGDASFSFTGVAAQGFVHPLYPAVVNPNLTVADGGTITINARTVNVDGSNTGITTDSRNFGRSGDITVQAGDVFLSHGGQIAAQSILAGNSGNITVNATGRIVLNDGQIRALTGGSGDGGTINVTAGQSMIMSGSSSQISSSTRTPSDTDLDTFASIFRGLPQVCPSPCNYASLVNRTRTILNIADPTLFDVLRVLRDNFSLIAVDDLTVGSAGKLNVNAPQLTLSAGALVSSSTGWDGSAGEVAGNVGLLTVQSGSEIRSRSGFADPATGKLLLGSGNAGSITFTATDTISISNGSISTSTLGDGNGGNVSLTAGKTVNIVNGGSVSADSLGGTGLAGNIMIIAGDKINMNDSSVSTRAVTSDGGNITVNAPHMIQMTDSRITTSVESGVGGGGNINIDPEFLILNNSQILANAFGGPGGNINITADTFLVNSGGTQPTSLAGIVEASSALSTPGTINIEATVTDVSGTVAPLPETPLQATELLRAACAARFAGGKASSMVLSGRDGLPQQPGGLLPSPPYLASKSDTPATIGSATSVSSPTGLSLLGSSDRPSNRYSLLPNVNCS